MADVRLQPIKGEDDVPVRLEPCRQPRAVRQVWRHQLLIAPELLGDRALSDGLPTRDQILMDS
jgi:hypothetical protein